MKTGAVGSGAAEPPGATGPSRDTAQAAANATKTAAKQLEAFFLRQLLAEARPKGGGMLDGGFAGDTFKQMLDEAIADKMSAAGGVGMASLFAKQLGGTSEITGAPSPAVASLSAQPAPGVPSALAMMHSQAPAGSPSALAMMHSQAAGAPAAPGITHGHPTAGTPPASAILRGQPIAGAPHAPAITRGPSLPGESAAATITRGRRASMHEVSPVTKITSVTEIDPRNVTAPTPSMTLSTEIPRFVVPVTGRPSSGYGLRTDPIHGGSVNHPGFDLAAPTGTEVAAAARGTVVHAGPAGTYGNLVTLRHDDGFETRYAHLSEVDVKVGDVVESGDEIGKVGSTGHSTGPHLHFEIRQDGKAIDPAPLLPLNSSASRTTR